MQRRRSANTWLLDAYRTSCTLKGRLPKKWIEERLLKIPHEAKWLSLKLTPPEHEPAPTQRELAALIEILFRPQNRQKSDPTRNDPPHALPLAAAMAEKRKQTSQFVIPGMQKTSTPPFHGEGNDDGTTLPVQSLEIGGEGATPMIIQELRFGCLQLSQRCLLRDLIIRSSTQQPHDHDCVTILSLCSPLRRSLRRLVIQNSPSFRISCDFAWALFFGTTPLEHLSLEDTGMTLADVTFLCEILCDNEVPQNCLKVLKLKLSSTVCQREVTHFSEMEFVSIKRCLSMLKTLQHFEINALSTQQQRDLLQEWRALKGEALTDSISVESASDIQLSLLNKRVEDGLMEDVAFEEIPTVSEVLIEQPITPTTLPRSVPGFRVGKSSRLGGVSRPTLRIQKLPLGRTARQRTLPSYQERSRDDEGSPVLTVAERLWEKFKPPLPPRPSAHGAAPHRGVRKRTCLTRNPMGHIRATGTMPLEFYFESHEEEVSEGASDGDTEMDLDIPREDPARRKRPRFRRVYSPRSNRDTAAEGPSEQLRGRERGVCESQSRSESEGMEDEKCYGPPPGGRKVELRGLEADPDLMGYLSDGFIRPDDELVYTTSASDEEIEQDLSVLRCAGRRMAPLSSDSENEKAAPQTNPEPEVHEEVILLECDGVMEMKERGVQETSSGRKLTLSALEKELQELQPFYYDKNREKYQPGEFFNCDAEGEPTEGVTLRSGRHITQSSEPTAQASCPIDAASQQLPPEDHQEPDEKLEPHEAPPGMDEGGRQQKPAQRVQGSREARRLQFWAWDHNFEKFPPNEHMYFSRAQRRTRRTPTNPN